MSKVIKVSMALVLAILIGMFTLLNIGAITLYLPFRGPVDISLIFVIIVIFLLGGLTAVIITKILQAKNDQYKEQLRKQIINENNLRQNNLRLKLKNRKI